MALFVIGSAQAVHETGAFELDGNAVSANASSPLGPANDWDRVCHQDTGNAACGTSSDTSSPKATAVSWSGDCLGGTENTFGCGNLSATTFTGGGSKDPQDISNWAWNDGGGGLPAKDNLEHGFAARFSIAGTNSSGTCPNGTDLNGGTFDPSVNCQLLFFGSDRYDNSGDAQQGFWFFQNPIGLGTNSVGGGTGFTGVHKNGDVLVISDFSVGGTTSTITVYKWDSTCTKGVTKPNPGDCGDVNLRLLETSDAAKCTSGLAGNDAFCGIVNTDNTTTVPWSSDFLDKSGNSSTYLAGELYEGGINLSLLGLGNECFSAIAAETRASTSTTATLKDFILGSFAQCGAGIGSSASGGGEIGSNGTKSINDSATVTVSGGAVPPAPTGKVTFFLCGPSQTAITSCSSSDPTYTQKAQVTLPTTADTGTTNKYTVSNGAVSVSSAGYYCWLVSWPGDSNYKPTAPDTAFTHTGADECVQVTPRQPALTTAVSPGGQVTPGTAQQDTATFNPLPVHPSNGTFGTVTFTLYYSATPISSASCSGLSSSAAGTATVVDGQASYTSTSMSPTTPGYYVFTASYAPATGDNNNLAVSETACNVAAEQFQVLQFNPTMTTAQTVVISDSATISNGGGGGNLNGTAHFRPFSDSSCTTPLAAQEDVAVSGATTKTVSATTTVTFTAVSPVAAQTVYWKVSYTSNNSAQTDIAATCTEHTSATINN